MNDTYTPDGDDKAERALRSGLRAEPLSPEAMARIRLATEAEWRASVASTPWWRRGAALAAAASMLVAALGAVLFLGLRGGDGEPLGRLARADGAGLLEVRTLREDLAIGAGAPVRAGNTFAARGATLVTLEGGGNLRIAPGSQFDIVAANRLRLDRGEVYVDIPPGQRASGDFVVVTAAGEFRHVGTQFALALVDGDTRLRVREGRVEWNGGASPASVEAGNEVRIDGQRHATQRPIGTVGDDWAWVETMTPDIDIENRPLAEFLDWVCRETGRKLVADDNVRKQIAATRMHGNVRGMTALNALRAVMAATSMRFDLPEGSIRVSLASAAPQEHQ